MIIELWRKGYNTIKPHSALPYRPPAPEAVLTPLLAAEPEITTYKLGQFMGLVKINTLIGEVNEFFKV